MKNSNDVHAGPGWGVIAGVLLTVVGLSLGLFPRTLHSTGAMNDFVAAGVAMIGIFLVVYSAHELRRKRHR